MARLFTAAFWLDAGAAILRTFLAAFAPAIPAIFADPSSGAAWLVAILTALPVTILAAVHALAGLPSVDSGPWIWVAVQRAVRQFAQYFVAALPATFAIDGINWPALFWAALGSALVTFCLAASTILGGGTLTDDSDATVEVTSVATDSSTATAEADPSTPTVAADESSSDDPPADADTGADEDTEPEADESTEGEDAAEAS